METFFGSNPGFRSRIAHHIDFPDYDADELFRIAGGMLARLGLDLSAAAEEALRAYIVLRKGQPHFANARSLRNALDRARLRQANRLVASEAPIPASALSLLEAEDIRASRVFGAASSQTVNSA
jgi:hypothetical protein